MDAEPSRVALAFGLTLFAGLATGIGSVLAFFARRSDFRFLSVALGFSGGVMLYVSFSEILPKAEASLSRTHGPSWAGWISLGAFLAGALFIGLIDAWLPASRNPHEPRSLADLDRLAPGARAVADDRGLARIGLFSALAIAIHNFPEGLATFLAALEDPRLGLAIAVAVALHNIPEGVSVSVPIFFASGRRGKAFGLSFLSGLSEPAGAAIGYLVLRPVLTPETTGILFGAVAGVMVYVSLDELLPTAREYARGHEMLYGLFAGMAVMAASLLLVR